MKFSRHPRKKKYDQRKTIFQKKKTMWNYFQKIRRKEKKKPGPCKIYYAHCFNFVRSM